MTAYSGVIYRVKVCARARELNVKRLKCADASEAADHQLLKCVTRTDILELLRHLGRGSLEIARDALLLRRLDRIELLAEITVDDVLHRIVVRPEGQMIPAAERRMLGSHVHLEVLKEIVILVAGERHEDAHSAA